LLVVGYGTAQIAAVGGYFVGGSPCVSPSTSVQYVVENRSASLSTVTQVVWTVKNPDGSIKDSRTDVDGSSTLFPIIFSQCGIYKAEIEVTWGTVTRIDSMKIAVYCSPVAAFDDDGHIFPCPDISGRNIQFHNQSQGSIARLEWDWYDGTPRLIGPPSEYIVANPIHTYKVAGKYDVLLIVQDSNGCVDSAFKNEHVIILGAKGNVSYSVVPPQENGDCSPLNVEFTPSVNPNEPDFMPDSIYIYTDDGNVYTTKQLFQGDYGGLMRVQNHKYFGGAYLPTYFLYKTISFGGEQLICIVQIREEDTIYVVDLQPNFDTLPFYHPDVPITFNNISTCIPSHFSYDSVAWNFGNGDISHDYNGITAYDTTGIYQVQLTMKVMNCVRNTTRDIQVIEEGVGVEKWTMERGQWTIYPNPASKQLRVTVGDGFETRPYNIEIYDVVGQMVMQGKLQNNIINVESLSSGMYFLKVNGKTVKFVKE
jgi:PKD repeat protein